MIRKKICRGLLQMRYGQQPDHQRDHLDPAHAPVPRGHHPAEQDSALLRRNPHLAQVRLERGALHVREDGGQRHRRRRRAQHSNFW